MVGDSVNLSEEQKKIVHASPDSSIIVKAAAGTGKTRVLTERIIYLINEGNVDPNRILAVTFTNKAANEMKKRVMKRIKNPSKRPDRIETIDSVFGRILRENINLLKIDGNEDFQNIDAREKDKKVTGIGNKFHENKKICIKNKKQVTEVSKRFEELREKMFENGGQVDAEVSEIQAFKEYEEYLRENEYLDFEGIIFYARKLLERHPKIRNKGVKQYEYIFIDEIQDLNISRWELIKLLIKNGHTKFLGIGDTNQSVYLYNGDIVENIFDEIPKHLNIHLSTHLGTNYRSLPAIVELSSGHRRVKNQIIVPHIDSKSPSKIQKINGIRQMINVIKGIDNKYSNWAILYRNNSTANKIGGHLLEHQIPFQVSKFEFLKEENIEYLILLLKVSLFDNGKLVHQAITRTKFSELGLDEKVRGEINMRKRSLALFLFDEQEEGKEVLYIVDCEPLVRFIDKLHNLRAFPKENLSELAYYAASEFIHEDHYNENIPKFIKGLSSIQLTRTLESSIEILINLESIAQDPRNNDNDCIFLSTIHSAKGLEWENVMIIDFEKVARETEGHDKNLAYVASSRAKKNLFFLDLDSK